MNLREWTLPVYTILTQLSVGALLVIVLMRSLIGGQFGAERSDRAIRVPVLILLITGGFAILFAHFHLSRPYLSFLALRNLGSSWLSREILADLLYMMSLAAYTFFLWRGKRPSRGLTLLGWLAAALGLATDFCMSRIYLLPSQPAWDSLLTPISFLVTTLLLGVITIPVLLTMDLIFKKAQGEEVGAIHGQLIDLSMVKISVAAICLCMAMAVLLYFQIGLLTGGTDAAQTSLDLLLRIYQPLLILRLVLLFLGVGWLAVGAGRVHQAKLAAEALLQQAFAACLLVMVAEILGRFLFFAIHVRVGV